MTAHDGIDLYREFIEVFRREEMLALFDFQSGSGDGGTLSGLCKISRPRNGRSDSRYVSVLFIIEAPDEKALKEARTSFDAINWERLADRLPEFESVLSIPFALRDFTGSHFREIDIYLKDRGAITRRFIRDALCPAVCSVAGIRGGEPVFREELPDTPKETPAGPTGVEGSSLLSRLRGLLKL